MARGCRPNTKRPRHHVTVVQGLALAIDLAPSSSTSKSGAMLIASRRYQNKA
jgi:hypothetical protein